MIGDIYIRSVDEVIKLLNVKIDPTLPVFDPENGIRNIVRPIQNPTVYLHSQPADYEAYTLQEFKIIPIRFPQGPLWAYERVK